MKLRDDTLRTVHHHKEQGRNIQWSAWLTSVLVFNLLAGCAGPATTPFSPSLDPTDYLQLDVGYRQISPYFGYDVEGGFSSGRRIIIYHVADPQEGKLKEPLATIGISYVGNKYYRSNVFGVSNDGKVLLYRHSAHPSAPDGIKNKRSGLYEYIHGRGDLLIRASGAVFVESSTRLPKDAIIFAVPNQEADLYVPPEVYIRTISGDEYPANVHGGNALHRAAYLGETEKVRELLRSGTNLEARDARGFSPLHEAIWRGHQKVVKELLNRGADVNATIASLDWTPLHEAARFGHNAIVDLLIAKGADVNARNRRGKSPFHIAMEYGKTETAKHLVKRGARVTAADYEMYKRKP